MITDNCLSRRGLLSGAGLSLIAAPMRAMQEPAIHGLEALLDGTAMARIPAGEFVMGSDSGNEDEGPPHRVRISQAFDIGKYEVSQAQWETVMTDPHARPNAGWDAGKDAVTVAKNPSHFKGSSLPVENVSWDAVQIFLKRLNARDDAHRYRLPTEAEWEYACTGGKTGAGASDLAATAWYKQNSEERTQPVGRKEPNGWGVYDMLGNVAEWVQDWYGPDYYAASPATNPPGPESGSYRVFRGGCWFDSPKYCRTSLRRFDFPISEFYYVGFRIVRTPR